MEAKRAWVRWFSEVDNSAVGEVGGKNASLGELTRSLQSAGIRVPPGFASTADAYRTLLEHNGLTETLTELLGRIDSGALALHQGASEIRGKLLAAELPPPLEDALREGYRELARRVGVSRPDVAVRSSATAEDLPSASFAGQQESFLNIQGEEALLDAFKRCVASLFTDRAISYRQQNGFEHMKVALSVGVQKMVRSDRAGSGVAFTLDTETGFPEVVLIDAVWGLGESLVKGEADPDEYRVFKPLLSDGKLEPVIERTRGAKERKLVYDDAQSPEAPTRYVDTSEEEREGFVLSQSEVLQLARWAVAIESHYGRPMDIEWAKDGETGELYVVQARPETIHAGKAHAAFRSYRVGEHGRTLVTGQSVGSAVAVGRAFRIDRPDQGARFEDGGVLVTAMTDPDWVPLMRRASAVVTDHGGRTSHAAIVSRELGLPAVIGTGGATRLIPDGHEVTVSCAEGDRGFVYEGRAEIETREINPGELPRTRTKVMVNLADPAAALRWWKLPTDGVGLARMEFIVGRLIQIHPMALVHFERIEDADAREQIEHLTRGYTDKAEYFVDQLALGISRLAASQYPRPLILRTSDFKTNEYAALIGGGGFEPHEENPMIGWRGASRYYHPDYEEGFALECAAIRRARERLGFTNIVVMIPFCRTLGEADRVLEVMARNGLRRGVKGLEIYMMCEVPSNVVLAERFAERFDGFSIGSNDLTQLTLGIDRDSERLSELFDETDEAVTSLIREEISRAHRSGTPVGFCGQAPSNDPAFARFLVAAGIDSVSVTPDSFVEVKRQIAEAESAEERPSTAQGDGSAELESPWDAL